MNISYHWLKSYVPLTATPEKIAERLTQVGLEVGSITPFVPLSPALVIGKTLSCEPHPQADKLKKLRVDIGEDQTLQIICGAANVDAGQKVIVAPVGTTITSLRGEKHKIKRVKIRGEHSEGMICSPYEIGVGEDHQGILVLDTTRPAGTPATTHFSMPSDTIFEIDITPNMGHACSHLGIARELAAVSGKTVERPTPEPLIASDSLPLTVDVQDPTLCPRYTAVVIKDVQVGPSPLWLRNRLTSIGLKPVNNIVDITNWIMHDLGQPLHAFDYAQIHKHKMYVGPMKPNTTMTTLHGDDITLRGQEIMIYDEEGPLCLAGILGSQRGHVNADTRTIILESACFAPHAIAQTARQHNIHTDASFRFERGTDIEMPYIALQQAVALIEKLAHGIVASTPIDHYPHKAAPLHIPITYDAIDALFGKPLVTTTLYAILKRLDIAVEDVTEQGFTALVPPYRTQLTRPIDIIAAIIRIHGYAQVPPQPCDQHTPTPAWAAPRTYVQQDHIAQMLVAQGFLEIKTNSLMSHASLDPAAPPTIKVTNPLSQELDTLRPSLLYHGLDTLAYNLHRDRRVLKFFEIGNVYHPAKKGYQEETRLALFLAGDAQEIHWHHPSRHVTLHDLHTIVAQLLRYSGVPSLEAIPVDSDPHYDTCIALQHEGTTYAHVGAVATHLCEQADIKVPVFFTEIPMPTFLSSAQTQPPVHYHPIPQTPAIVRDISLALPAHVTYTQVVQVIQAQKLPYTFSITLKDLYQGQGLAQGEKAYTLRLVIQGRKTFREAAIRQVMQRIETALADACQAKIRG